jgi:hypothetical protein
VGGEALTQREPSLVTPFWVRIATETSLSPGWLLIAFPAVLYPAYLALEVLFGRGLAAATDFAGDLETWIPPSWIGGLGYFSMMSTYVARGTFRDLEALRPVLRAGEATFEELRQQLTQFDRHRLWIGAFFGFALFTLSAELAVGRWTSLLAGEWSLRATWIVVTGFAAWMVFWRVVVYLIDSSRLYSRIGERHLEVDLLNLAPLSPLTRHGLRCVLFIAISGVCWVIATVAAPASTRGSVTGVLFIVLFLFTAVAILAFVFPVRGLRRHIQVRKAEELARVRDDIHHNRELAAKPGPEASQAGGQLPGLLAFEKRIESVREWPFDAPTLTRFFLYVAIPLGSWLGGALVERLLGAALD